MKDYTEGYDPTKPLIIEMPLKTLVGDTLIYDEEESDIDYYSFYRGELFSQLQYKLIFKFPKSEKRLTKLNVVPASFPGLIVDSKVLAILNDLCPEDFQSIPILIKNVLTKKVFHMRIEIII